MMSAAVVDEEEDVAALQLHAPIQPLQPLLKEDCRHPRLLVGAVDDGQCRLVDTPEAPRPFGLPDHQRRQLLPSRGTSEKHGDALL